MLQRLFALLFVLFFLSACEEGEILPGVSVDNGEGMVSLSRSVPTTLYIGVEHTLTLDAPNGDIKDLEVSVSDNSTANAALTGGNGQPWKVSASTPGDLLLTVENADGQQVNTTTFKVKRIPDPVARLGNLDDGPVASGEFRAQGGVIAWLDNFDFDARCDIVGFELVYVAKRQDPVPVTNQGASFSANSRTLIQRATPGDLYYFTNVRAKCPGDPASRRVNSMVFRIK